MEIQLQRNHLEYLRPRSQHNDAEIIRASSGCIYYFSSSVFTWTADRHHYREKGVQNVTEQETQKCGGDLGGVSRVPRIHPHDNLAFETRYSTNIREKLTMKKEMMRAVSFS